MLVSDEGDIIAGHGRVEAAKLLGMCTVPTLALSHLNDAERRAYVLADNKLALNAGWDKEILAIELQGLIDLDFDVELTGFSLAEVDLVLDEAGDADPDGSDAPEDHVPELSGTPVSMMGDVWLLGRHRLLCGDARQSEDLALLMQNERADMIFTDPPYNVKIDGNVCGLGSVKHREFAMATGEMSEDQFVRFLTETLGNMSSVMRNGAIAFVCMDWRHSRTAGAAAPDRAAASEHRHRPAVSTGSACSFGQPLQPGTPAARSSQGSPEDARPLPASRQASPFFCQKIL